MLRQKQFAYPRKEESYVEAAHSGMADIHHHMLISTTNFSGPMMRENRLVALEQNCL